LYVFDGISLAAHLTGANSLVFAPSGLGLLTRLAEVTDEIRQRVRDQIAERERPHNFGLWFEGRSEVVDVVSQLDARTNPAKLQRLGTLSPEETSSIAVLENEVAQIKSHNTERHLAERRRAMHDSQQFLEAVEHAQRMLGESAVVEAERLLAVLRGCRESAQRLGASQFKIESLSEVGTNVWAQFVVAAKALADAESKRGTPYPTPGDHCLLCQQSLSSDAVSLIQRIWAFLQSDAQGQLRDAEKTCERKARDLGIVNVSYFAADSTARRLLEADLPALVPAIESQAEAFSARQQSLVGALKSGTMQAPPPTVNADLNDVRKLVGLLESEVAALEKDDPSARLRECEDRLRALKHRQVLSRRMSEVVAYVDQRRWAAKARESLGSTYHITTKYNDLFRELVTDRYTSLFQATLTRFNGNMRVTVETRGQKGGRVRQIALSPAAFPAGYSVDRVLSDGEKAAVAIADFLTEADVDESSGGIILDDPITSLDNEWKDVLADCLAERSKNRQVVIFTHDLAFAYHIVRQAKKHDADVATHWIREEGGQPGFVYADNSPVCESDYKAASSAREWYTKAKDLPPEAQQACLQQGFGALRTSYEALIIFHLFNGVVARFEERIRFDKLKDVRVRREDTEEIIERMSTLSRHIDAHLHSDQFVSAKPTPQLLWNEIQAFERIKARLKEIKKTESVTNPAPATAPPIS